jgi:hypothetical protein
MSEDIAKKRLVTLVKAWAKLVSNGAMDSSKYTLNASFANKAVEHYLRDLEALKRRYGIPGKVEMPKIAGLMAYSIMKFKPLIPINGKEENIKDFGGNELLAIYYGLCVCADLGNGNADDEAIQNLLANPFFKEWFGKFNYLLSERNYTSESLIMIFDTLGFVFGNGYESEA